MFSSCCKPKSEKLTHEKQPTSSHNIYQSPSPEQASHPHVPHTCESLPCNFILGNVIGRGAFGIVRFTISKDPRVELATKVIDKKVLGRKVITGSSYSAAKTWLDMCRDEIEVMKKLKHPHILRLHQVIEAENVIYMIMELAEGPASKCRERIHENQLQLTCRPLAMTPLRRCLRHSVEGLLHLHSKGLAHGDIKPENILRLGNGNYVIADFSLTTMVTEGKHGTHRPAMSSPTFNPPETDMGEKADTWALGVSAYMLAFGTHPFCQNVCGPDFQRKLSARIQRVQYDLPPCDEWLHQLIEGCLKFNPADRPTLSELKDLLEADRSSMHFSSTHLSLTPEASRLELPTNAIQGVIRFRERRALTVQSSIELNPAQELLLTYHSAVNVFNIINHMLEKQDLSPYPGYTAIVAAVRSLITSCLTGGEVSSLSHRAVLKALRKWITELEALLSSGGRLSRKHVHARKYIATAVLPVLHLRVDEIEQRSRDIMDSVLTASSMWERFSVRTLLDNLAEVFAAVNLSPDSEREMAIRFFGNGDELVQARRGITTACLDSLEESMTDGMPSAPLPTHGVADDHIHTIRIAAGLAAAELCPVAMSFAAEVDQLGGLSMRSGMFMVSQVALSRGGDDDDSSDVASSDLIDIGGDIAVSDSSDDIASPTMQAVNFDDSVLAPPVFQDVLRDLVLNARKYSSAGVIRAAIWNQARQLHLVVSDCGHGIQDVQKSIQFGTREHSDQRRTFGFGFGLSKSVFMTQTFGGTFNVSTLDGVGTRFHIVLPMPDME
eukprot:gnl/Dysnectes_brevis/4045_a5286_750.p1 GENE.gnl/Dysnectes_brevis/4045_a5286_750~~gnl/Dysnectes_brevis/4045_a5286_750.p1  ORF type:complete len:799 (+),score=268.46 gnl/Dysnectes_brevis/4045_a5286_750:58-2397(+)